MITALIINAVLAFFGFFVWMFIFPQRTIDNIERQLSDVNRRFSEACRRNLNLRVKRRNLLTAMSEILQDFGDVLKENEEMHEVLADNKKRCDEFYSGAWRVCKKYQNECPNLLNELHAELEGPFDDKGITLFSLIEKNRELEGSVFYFLSENGKLSDKVQDLNVEIDCLQSSIKILTDDNVKHLFQLHELGVDIGEYNRLTVFSSDLIPPVCKLPKY